MSNRLRFVRGTYWFGVIFDGAMVAPMLSPALGAQMLGLGEFNPGADYKYAIGLAAALMAGWTALLAWGLFDPVARRGVLLLTAFPVVAGLFTAGVYAVTVGFVPLAFMLPIFASQVLGIGLFVAAYLVGGRLQAAKPVAVGAGAPAAG